MEGREGREINRDKARKNNIVLLAHSSVIQFQNQQLPPKQCTGCTIFIQ